MARDLPVEQNIFSSGARPNVMDYQKIFRGFRNDIADDANVRNFATEVPRNDIARQIVVTIRCYWLRLAFALQEGHEIQDTTVINIAVRSGVSPSSRVVGPGDIHVLVYFLLQIDSGLAKSADNYV